MSISAATSAREILNPLHDVLASRINAQAKLNEVAALIAEQLSSDLCPIHLLRDAAVVLYATLGPKQEAVHVTKLALVHALVVTVPSQLSTLARKCVVSAKIVPF